ncbi:MAG: PDZ domain-containing protein [Saprospirales bacterium]|jgi:carboxyl-terminal processing protease|nr:PDZ domain-containing protein [Saprospirales bacterium]MBK8920757.1 PDZ domain-containing protein [Saprospirales bacterium]
MTEQPSPKVHVRLPILFAAVLAAGMFIGQQLPRYDHHARFLPAGYQARQTATALDEILRYIEAKYVDTVDLQEIKQSAIAHLLEQLDPHSVYMSPEELQQEEEVMNGNFEGIGIEFLVVEDTIRVITPLSGGPSEAAGILAGDKLVTINDTLVAGVKITTAEIFRKLRGSKGSNVKIGIRRARERNLRYFNIARDVIPVHSVDVAYMLDDKTGYVKINRFSAPTYQEFMEAIGPLVEEKGMTNLVLDLRGNPGGYLNEATELLSQFFAEGKLLVYTEGRADERHDYKSNGRARFNIQNIAVLIDEGSASASEIVAGAVQDHDRGWVIGRRSFGKGLVQVQYPLSDGGALRLTISRYYTPSGRSIQREYKNNQAYDEEAEIRLKNGELADASRFRPEDTTKYYTGMGRVVFGGGGIAPDIFIPLDTSFVTDYFVAARQHLPPFASRWLETQQRGALPATLDDFVRKFNIPDQVFEDFLAYVEKQDGKTDPLQLARSRAELRHQLKARIAKLLFQDIGMYRVLHDGDTAVKKALHVLRSGQPVAKNSR